MGKWDISRIATWTWKEFPIAAVIPEAGNSDDYVTGGWRSERPFRDEKTCNQCLLCWIMCPDTAINVADEQVTSFDLSHCKGCGICAQVCPVEAITMSPEGCELPEVTR